MLAQVLSKASCIGFGTPTMLFRVAYDVAYCSCAPLLHQQPLFLNCNCCNCTRTQGCRHKQVSCAFAESIEKAEPLQGAASSYKGPSAGCTAVVALVSSLIPHSYFCSHMHHSRLFCVSFTWTCATLGSFVPSYMLRPFFPSDCTVVRCCVCISSGTC